MILLILNALGLSGAGVLALIRALTSRHATVLDRVLGRLPAPRLPRRRTSPGTAIAAPVAVPAKTPPRAHGGSQCVCDAYGGCPQGCPRCRVCQGDDEPAPVSMAPRGRHHAGQPLALKWDDLRGQYRHTETGPMTVPAGYGADLRSARKLVAP